MEFIDREQQRKSEFFIGIKGEPPPPTPPLHHHLNNLVPKSQISITDEVLNRLSILNNENKSNIFRRGVNIRFKEKLEK